MISIFDKYSLFALKGKAPASCNLPGLFFVCRARQIT
jgi:hypothetical protein